MVRRQNGTYRLWRRLRMPFTDQSPQIAVLHRPQAGGAVENGSPGIYAPLGAEIWFTLTGFRRWPTGMAGRPSHRIKRPVAAVAGDGLGRCVSRPGDHDRRTGYRAGNPAKSARSDAAVPQDISLFHRSIMENIRYGRPSATDNEVLRAAIAARCDFIEALPEGMETIVGDRGIKVSGGQRQRIAIARAFLKDAPILLLDEATAALDSESEEAIREALSRLMRGRTVIAIAHRLATLRNFDRVVMLQGGRIIDDGPPDLLMQGKGPYRELVARKWAACEPRRLIDRSSVRVESIVTRERRLRASMAAEVVTQLVATLPSRRSRSRRSTFR